MDAAARLAAAIGDPGRARMLYALLDGRARTSTELAGVAEVTPSTASIHLARLREDGLVTVVPQGKHRFYALAGPDVAAVLESLSVLATGSHRRFVPTTPSHLRAARSCYDHLAGSAGVALHDRIRTLGWITSARAAGAYDLTPKGERGLAELGLDVAAAREARRRFAYACLDWSERRSHLGGSLGAALLSLALSRKWIARAREPRMLRVTPLGQRELAARLGLRVEASRSE